MKLRSRLLLVLLPLSLSGILTFFFPSLFLAIALPLFLVTVAVYLISDQIARPIQELHNSALSIAAGQYGQTIEVAGPREVVDLANTLNTMSQCLLENINRLKENSLIREKMFGEYECATWLQELMLKKSLEDLRSSSLAGKSITFFSDNPRGLLLEFPRAIASQSLLIRLTEAPEEGFEGMYQLLSRTLSDTPPHLSLELNKRLHAKSFDFPLPLYWSLENKTLTSASEMTLEAGDLFFLCNPALFRYLGNPIPTLSKVLRHYAADGLETVTEMLKKELALAVKRRDSEEDLHLLCFQVLN